MNLVLLLDEDFVAPDRARLTGRRLAHVRQVHKAVPGDTLAVGRLGGLLGQGRVLGLDDEALDLEVELTSPPPPKRPLTLILALPRPKVLNRAVAAATSLGVARLVLLNAFRVEKSYWGSPRLSDENLRLQRLLGLEQARDTVLPELLLRRRFRPFVEDELPALAAGATAIVAHPAAPAPLPRAVEGPLLLALGPEGGFIPYEIEALARAGLQPASLGPRILRVETALAATLGRLLP
jgi:RsmE family RNA methyltransferase